MNHPGFSPIYFRLVMPVIFSLMALFFIGIALRILVTRRPLILTSRWLFALICVGFLPSFLNSFLFKSIGLITWMNPLLFGVLLIFFWIQMKGYIVFGVSDSYFRDALLSSAKGLGYTPEESMSRLRIHETGEEFQVSIQGWIGSAQFKPVGKSSSSTTRDIAGSMRRYFFDTPGKMNYLVVYFYLIIGVFMVATGIGLSTFMHSLKH